MGLSTKPEVIELEDGTKYWEHTYNTFKVKVVKTYSGIEGMVHNYTFRAPLLTILEEECKSIDESVAFAKETGLADIASKVDSTVLFVYPTCEGGWENATVELYKEFISEVKMHPYFEDGISIINDFFTGEFKGYFMRGAIFRADIYGYGKSADYIAENLLQKIDGEYLWGPGDITPAMCSMERLSVIPEIQRKDIAVLSVGNSDEINASFAECDNVLIKDTADYRTDFNSFVKKFKMWCGNIQFEPDFDELKMKEEPGSVVVKTSEDHYGDYKGTTEHKVGYFAYFNNDTFENGSAPLVIGFHGGGDSTMYLTFVSEWYKVANKYGFLYVAVENHQNVTATEAIEVIEDIKKKYNVDSNRIYATGFSMGSGKTWDLFQQYPETFAGVMPCSALFPVYSNPFFGGKVNTKLNKTVPVPVFYSGGEESPLPELPCHNEWGVERVSYVAEVNKCVKKFEFDIKDKENWDEPVYGIEPDRLEKFYDEERGSTLTVRYYDSIDGICRTAFASVSGQQHECRRHSCEEAWKFISQFTR